MAVQEHQQKLLQEQTLTCQLEQVAMLLVHGPLTLAETQQLQRTQQTQQTQLLLQTAVLLALTVRQVQ
jgi:hypothetical protein